MTYSLLIKLFLRSKVAIIGLSFLFFSGVTSILIGKEFISKQQKKVETTCFYQKNHISKTVKFQQNEMGLLLYYLKFAYVNQVEPLTGLSIGQRDINLGIQQITIRNLEEKKYDSDLSNPAALQLGNLDFSFVLIYLFPLIIIAFSYNVISEEKEDETWKLLCIQSKNPWYIIFQKLIIRYVSIVGVLLLLLSIAMILFEIPLKQAFLATILISILYVSFWFLLISWIITWQKSSSYNAISLLSIWLFLNVVAPAFVNNFLLAKYPIPEALKTSMASRDGYHRKWDEDKESTMIKFYKHYPQFKKYKLPEKTFSWLWYYAMQQMGDDEASTYSSAMKLKLLQRENVSNITGYFLPSLHIQLQLNNLANSGLQNQLEYLDSISSFHEMKRIYFYPKIFENRPVSEENWSSHKVAFFIQKNQVNWPALILPTFIIISILIFLI
jgi:ABC-2 type transport system permease protein